jgi:hypothetical protein
VLIGPTRAAGGLLGTVAALGGVLPATLTAGAVLEALSAILVRGVGLAAITFRPGSVAATVPPRQDLAVRPEWVEAERRQRARAEARTRRRVARRVEREGADPRSEALAVSLGGDLDGWRIGSKPGALVVPPPGQLDLSMLLLGQPGVGKSVAISRLAHLGAKERRHLCIVDAKGGADGLAGDVAEACWPPGRMPASACSPRRRSTSGAARRRRSSTGCWAAGTSPARPCGTRRSPWSPCAWPSASPGRPAGPRPSSWPASSPTPSTGPGTATRRC